MENLSEKTPVQLIIEEINKQHKVYKKANMGMVMNALEALNNFAKEVLVVEKMALSEQYHKGHKAGVIDGKTEANVKVI